MDTPFTPKAISLHEASDPQYFGTPVVFEALVVGKETVPFSSAKDAMTECPEQMCASCPNKMDNGFGHCFIPENDPLILELIECNHFQRDGVLRREIGIPNKCFRSKLRITETHLVEAVRVSPIYDWHIQTQEREYLLRNLFIVGNPIATNQPYKMTGVTLAHPKTQVITHLVWKAEPLQHSIDSFTMTPEMAHDLKIFQPVDDDEAIVEGKLTDIYEDFTYNVTKRYNRQDLLMAVDLTYHSVLQFYSDGRLQKRGWMECLVLGDTQCGKSDSVEGLMRHYRLGEKILAENASFAGLVGGVQQIGQRWAIQWGKLPLNDRRILIVDELSGFNSDDLARLSGVRSEGKAEITKIQSFQTSSRTRIVWITNPKTGKKLTQYSYGVNAIRELFKQPEDIARIDLFVTATEADFHLEDLPAYQQKKVPHIYTSDLCRNLVLWVWSRKADQTIWAEGTQEEILKEALDMRSRYDSKIPLVLENAQHLRLERVSAAIAARLFSTDDTYEQVIVKPVHVRVAAKFIRSLLDKPSMGYNLYSLQGRSSDDHIQRYYIDIVTAFKTFEKWDKLRDHMLKNETLKPSVIKMMLGYSDKEIDRLFSWMNDHHLIVANKYGYYKHRQFVAMLKKLLGEERTNGFHHPAGEIFEGVKDGSATEGPGSSEGVGVQSLNESSEWGNDETGRGGLPG